MLTGKKSNFVLVFVDFHLKFISQNTVSTKQLEVVQD